MKMIQIQDLFEVYNSQNLALNACTINEQSSYVLINRSENNNGIAARINTPAGKQPFPAGLMTVALSGSVLSTFIQTEPFFTSYHVATLKPKVQLSIRQMLYYKMCIEANKFRFSYGRQANRTLPFLEIPAPEEIPAWVETIELPQQYTGKAKSDEKVELPPVSEWKEFKYTDLFDLEKARGPKVSEIKNTTGSTAYISATSENNGIKCFCNVKPEHEGKRITCGHLGDCFYQEIPFVGSNVVVMNPKFSINRQIGLFMTTILNQNKFLFSYAGGGVAGISKLSKMSLSLPVTSKGQPDYDLMERYINSLPYSDCL